MKTESALWWTASSTTTGREFFAFQDIREKREASPYKDWYRGVNFGWGSPLGDPFGYEAWQGHFELPLLKSLEPGGPPVSV